MMPERPLAGTLSSQKLATIFLAALTDERIKVVALATTPVLKYYLAVGLWLTILALIL